MRTGAAIGRGWQMDWNSAEAPHHPCPSCGHPYSLRSTRSSPLRDRADPGAKERAIGEATTVNRRSGASRLLTSSSHRCPPLCACALGVHRASEVVGACAVARTCELDTKTVTRPVTAYCSGWFDGRTGTAAYTDCQQESSRKEQPAPGEAFTSHSSSCCSLVPSVCSASSDTVRAAF